MKVIIYSDAQFNPWSEFSRILPSGLNSRFQDQLNAQDEVFKACKLNEASLLIHPGDLFESMTDKISKSTFLTVYNKFVEFSKSGIVVVLIVGNHDWVDRTTTSHILEPFKEIENVVVVDSLRVEDIGNSSFCFIPYVRQGFRELVNEAAVLSKESKRKYLFTHQGVRGAAVGPRDVILKDEYGLLDFKLQNFTYAFNGHYHKPQKLGPKNFFMIGSLIQKDFGERGDRKRYLLLDTETNEVTSFWNNSSPKFFKMSAKAENFRFPPDFDKDKDFLWVESDDAELSTLPILKEIEGRIRIDIDTRRLKQKEPRTDIKISMSREEQCTKYVESSKTELDKDRLINMGIEKIRRLT